MLQRRKRAKRRRVSFAQMLREAGPRARTALRHARVWIWRFRRSPERQDRAAAIATFAFIGLFTIGSVDAVITGGADFDVGATAYAGEYATAPVVRAPSSAAPTLVVEPIAETETLKTAAADEIDYSFTTEELLGGPEFATITEEVITDLPAAMGMKPVDMKEPDAASAAEDDAVL
jgi:hypothetical protein